ncbi:hypothetical protein A5893_14635 [Pedobacter psychrophilus]|uniref:Uncharacterized protein n=1 Tax=Pedobacter psychrophilus TaxID=1826909 RepID=A0A179DD63_9SPHI|nr:hypothetical protein A5893_14635 [Pedobacter psychrophilus]
MIAFIIDIVVYNVNKPQNDANSFTKVLSKSFYAFIIQISKTLRFNFIINALSILQNYFS